MRCPACGYENLAGADECAGCRGDLRQEDLPEPADSLAHALTVDPVQKLIPREPLTLAEDTPIREAVAKLVETGRNCVLVTRQGSLCGILTERDILMKIADRYEDLADEPVSAFMSRDPESLTVDCPAVYGLNRMTVGNYRHIPIVENDVPVGVISIRDILALLVENDSSPAGE